MKKPSILFLEAIILLLGAGVLFICFFILFFIIPKEVSGDFDYLPLLIGLYVPAVPFFIALHQSLKILRYIDQNTAFSQFSVDALKKIKFSSFAIALFFLIVLPYVFYLGDKDDAPGLVLVNLIFIFASFVIATFAALLQKLLQEAINIKAENDLTV